MKKTKKGSFFMKHCVYPPLDYDSLTVHQQVIC